jgi:hypothetical protein
LALDVTRGAGLGVVYFGTAMLIDVLADPMSAPEDLARDGVALLAAHLLAEQLSDTRRRALIEAAMPWTLATMNAEAAALEASACLTAAGIGHVVIKGPVLAADWRSAFGADVRTYTDVDLLVRQHDVVAASNRLVGDLEASPAAGSVGERAFTLPSGAAIDLHWLIVNDAAAVRRHRLDTDLLLRRARTDGAIAHLDRLDAIIHVCLHAVISDGSRLAAAIDVATMLRAEPFDPAALLQRARDHRAVLPLAVMTDRAALVTGFDEALDLANRLPRSPWRAACRHWAGSARPASGRRWTGGELLRATRQSTLASVSAVAASVPANLRTQRALRRGEIT